MWEGIFGVVAVSVTSHTHQGKLGRLHTKIYLILMCLATNWQPGSTLPAAYNASLTASDY